MGVYVKGMEMPKDCYDCPCHNGENGRCQIPKETTEDKRPYDCTLVEEKTGRWLDMGKFTDIDGNHHEVWKCDCCGFISHDDSNFCPQCGAKMEVE